MAETISETLEYKTQIHKAWDGSEQRVALRNYPRRSVSYYYYGMTPAQSQYLRALSYAGQNTKIELPLWHAPCQMSVNAYKDMSHILVKPSDMWLFYGCSGVQFWKDDIAGGERYFMRALNADGTINLSEILEKDYYLSNRVVYPVCYGYLKAEDDYVIYTASNTNMQLNVDLIPNYPAMPIPISLDENHYEAWGTLTPYQKALPAKYNNVDIFPLAPSWTGDLSAKFSRNANALDNGTGIVKYDLKSVYSSETKEIEYILASKTEITNFQRFFMRCKGRLKSFYAPTWLNDIVLKEDVPQGQAYFIVKWSLYWKYYSNLSRRKLMIIFLRNHNVKIVPIAGFSLDVNNNGKIFLDTGLSETLKAADVVMISFLCRYRFDSDSLTMDFATTWAAITTAQFAEVND